MPIYKVIFNFAGGGEGWTESHYCQNSATNPQGVLASAQAVATARAAFLGAPFILNAIRISAYSTEGVAPIKSRRASFLWKQIFPPGMSNQFNAEPSVVALQFIGYPDPVKSNVNFLGNQNQTFCGGPQDACIDEAGNVFPARTNLSAAWPIWKQALTNGNYGWVAVNQILNVPIMAATQNANGTQMLTLPPGSTAPLIADQYYPARVSQINGGRSPLNRQLLVVSSSTASVTTKEVIATALAQVGGFIRIYAPISTFVWYGNLNLSLETVKHKRFQGFLRRPGRARRQIRG